MNLLSCVCHPYLYLQIGFVFLKILFIYERHREAERWAEGEAGLPKGA